MSSKRGSTVKQAVKVGSVPLDKIAGPGKEVWIGHGSAEHRTPKRRKKTEAATPTGGGSAAHGPIALTLTPSWESQNDLGGSFRTMPECILGVAVQNGPRGKLDGGATILEVSDPCQPGLVRAFEEGRRRSPIYGTVFSSAMFTQTGHSCPTRGVQRSSSQR